MLSRSSLLDCSWPLCELILVYIEEPFFIYKKIEKKYTFFFLPTKGFFSLNGICSQVLESLYLLDNPKLIV